MPAEGEALNKNEEENYTSLKDLIKNLRLRIFPLSIFALIIALLLGLFTPIDRDQARYLVEKVYETYISELNAREKFSEKVFFIFMHNSQVSIMMLLPVMGFAFTLFSMYWSGVTMHAFIIVQPNISRISMIIQLFSVPSTWLELIAYSIAFTESLYSTIMLAKKKNYTIVNLILTLLIVESMLLFSACIETLYIMKKV